MTIKELLKIATDKKASDLHLIVGVPPAIRFDGSLEY
ncbi:MAG: type IV pili twitching motility protein PilT, partial [Patescibacteria group bacterium]|nr:type IV pili twitching motility protein PilT [Patescibacteria group bacterium]